MAAGASEAYGVTEEAATEAVNARWCRSSLDSIAVNEKSCHRGGIFLTSASGRKRPIKTSVFEQSERPLSGKADIETRSDIE